MRAPREKFVASQSGGPKRFLRRQPPVWKPATAEMLDKDPFVAEALGQKFDLHRHLRANKSEGWGKPSPDRWLAPCGNGEGLFLDSLVIKRNSPPLRQHAASSGPRPLPVPLLAPDLRDDQRSDRPPPNPASSATRKD